MFRQKYKLMANPSLSIEKIWQNFDWIIDAPNGASKNKDDHAIFSNEGPYLIRPALTNKPSVIPKVYNLKIIKAAASPILILILQIMGMLK